MKHLGVNSYRFSIEWSKIEPVCSGSPLRTQRDFANFSLTTFKVNTYANRALTTFKVNTCKKSGSG